MATDATRYEASDPHTSPSRLQELTSDPELWPLIAANPSAYDSLVAWLGENGGPDVRAAIATRPSAGAPTATFAPTPAAHAPETFAPVGSPEPRSGGSNKGLWITLGVLLFVLISGGIGTGVWALTRDDDSSTSTEEDTTEDDSRTEDESKDGDDSRTDEDDESRDEDADDESVAIDCDALEDLEDAASDLNYYYPGLDEESDLEDALAVIEEFADADEPEIADAVEILLTYGEYVQDNPDDTFSDEWMESIDAEYAIGDYIFAEC